MTKIAFRIICMLLLLTCINMFAGCKNKEKTVSKPKPRPVTVIELRNVNPIKPLQLTGSVKSWKEQDVSFEVDGLVEWIVEMGTNLEGRWKEGDVIRVQGDPLARLDKRLYEIRLKAAVAERNRANAEYVRKKQAWEKRAISEVDFIRATADRDAKDAEFEQAEYNLDRCILYAPFPGEVSKVYVEAGGYVQKGQAVAHLVMMDPIKVDISVSSATAERLKLRDTVRLLLPGSEEAAYGSVYEKATIADPNTRTFRVSILTRNRRSVGDLPSDSPFLKYPRITQYYYLERMRVGDDDSPFFVEENKALHKEGNHYYVWAAPDQKLGNRVESQSKVITLRKYSVAPGKRRTSLQGLYLMRELTDIGELPQGSLIAMDVPDDFENGGKVLVATKQWRLRPGQLIPVVLSETLPVPGLYLPMNSIKPIDKETGIIFIVDNGRAKKIKVKILSNVGELFRVDAVSKNDSNLVAAGSRVVIDYVHFLQDGEPIQVIKIEELKL